MKATIISVLCIFAVSSCAMSGGPGSPVLRTSPDDGEGPMIPNCNNVSATTKIDNYITGFYLTTWGSVYKEANSAVSIDLIGVDLMEQGNPDSFCRSYDADADDVIRAIQTILPSLGNNVIRADTEFGFFATDFIHRQHRTARWKDRYYITVQRRNNADTEVRVLREVLISRPSKGEWSPHVPARSVGHNEAWILTRIDQLVNR